MNPSAANVFVLMPTKQNQPVVVWKGGRAKA
jgi:hypothetical protein